jgi:hypothetical protein
MPDEYEVRRQSIDPNRLLPGEQTDTTVSEDAVHWASVYTKLRDTKLQLIANLRELMERQPDDVKDELERADVRMLEMQVQRFEKRLAFWQGRLAELNGGAPARATNPTGDKVSGRPTT